MAFSKTTTQTALAGTLVSTLNATNTADDNVTGSSSGSIYQLRIDNSANSVPVYLKIADTANATGGTTTPILVLSTPEKRVMTYIIRKGLAFTSGLSYWCTTGPSAGSDSVPEGVVKITLLSS